MSDVGTAYVNIVPKADGIKNTLTKQFTKDGNAAGLAGGKSLMAGLSSTVAAAGAALAVTAGAALVAGITSAVSEGAKLEQSLGGIETLFKANADEVVKNAQQAYKTAGLSANEYMENVTSFSASLLQSLGGDTAAAAKVADMAMVDMSDNANKMGTDMSMIQNAYQGFAKQNYTMLDNLKLGYGGTKEEMERLLEDAGKLSGQEYDISSLNDVYEAIHVIQGELGITGTTAEEASSTLIGSFNSMKAALANFWGSLSTGDGIEDALNGLVETTVTFLSGNLIPAIGRVFQNLPKALSAVMKNDTVKSIPDMIEGMVDKIDEFAPVIAEKGADLIVKLGLGIIKALPRIVSVMGKIINAILKVIVGLPAMLLAKGLAAAMKFGAGLVKGFADALGKVKTAVNKLTEPIRNVVDKIKGFFPINIGKILSNLKLPHFSISGGEAPYGFGGKGSLPKFNVRWYAKGGIMTEPTLFAYGGGEKGSEAILPLDPFWKRLDEMQSKRTINNYWTVNGADDPNEWAQIAARRLELQMNAR